MDIRKPRAALSSGLLARKGAARPAMRSQFLRSLNSEQSRDESKDLEDLGWNDMGDVSSTASEGHSPAPYGAREQQEALSESYSRSIRMDSTPASTGLASDDNDADDFEEVAAASSNASDSDHASNEDRASLLTLSPSSTNFYHGGRDRSFTLRMSEARHSRLRNACVERNCSAQLLVTQAVDHYLSMMTQ